MKLLDSPLLKTFEKLSFWLFIATAFLNIQIVLAVFNPLSSGYNEYLDVSIYLFDLFFASFLVLFILNNKIQLLSIYREKMFHVEHERLFYALLAFIALSGATIFFAENKILGFYAILRLIQACTLFFAFFLIKTIDSKMFHVEHLGQSNNVPRGTLRQFLTKCSTWNIMKGAFYTLFLLALVNSIIGIFQIITGFSLGLSIFGESVFYWTDPGIAKIALNEGFMLRPYGLFLHPNILGGFLGLVILLFFLTKSMFHVEHLGQSNNVPRGTLRQFLTKCSTWNILSLILILAVFFLSFSKGAWIALIVSISYLWYQMFHVEHQNQLLNVPRGTFWSVKQCSTWNMKDLYPKMFHVEHFLWIIGGLLVILGFYFSINKEYFLLNSYNERFISLIFAFEQIQDSHYLGIGIGQHVYDIFIHHRELPLWMLQPVHNFLILVLSELGVLGLGIFLFFILSLWYVPRGTFIEKISARSIILYVGVLGLFDHYLWDIPQGAWLLWLALGFSFWVYDKGIDK